MSRPLVGLLNTDSTIRSAIYRELESTCDILEFESELDLVAQYAILGYRLRVVIYCLNANSSADIIERCHVTSHHRTDFSSLQIPTKNRSVDQLHHATKCTLLWHDHSHSNRFTPFCPICHFQRLFAFHEGHLFSFSKNKRLMYPFRDRYSGLSHRFIWKTRDLR